MSSRLSIPQPCPANWEQMTPVAGGRYCGNCEKVVVDFTRMSEAEVLSWFSRHGRSCGQFRPDQLAEPAAPRSWAAWLAAAAVALSACEAMPALPGHTMGEPTLVSADTVVVRGRVLGADDQPLAGALVSSHADTALHVRTQPDGSFALPVPRFLADSLLVVVAPSGTGQPEYQPHVGAPAAGLVVRLKPAPFRLNPAALDSIFNSPVTLSVPAADFHAISTIGFTVTTDSLPQEKP